MLPGMTVFIPPQTKKNLPTRFGVPIEKNKVITQADLVRLEDKLKEKFTFWTAYPDLWADEVLIQEGSAFSWKFYQRIMDRQMARVPLNHDTGARGVSKTFSVFFDLFHKAIFRPGSVWAFAAPGKAQAAQIAKQTFNDLMYRFPLLRKEIKGEPSTGSKDTFIIYFKNESRIEITAALETTRGRRFDGIVVDETRDQDGNNVNGILVPTTSKIRLTYGAGKMNPFEVRQCQNYTTSASSKSSYNYEKVLDLLMKMIINPKSAWVMGLDYKVPVKEGIYPASFVRDIKMDTTVTEQTFAQEYLSIYTSESEESWFNFKKMNLHRTILNAEWHGKELKDNAFYLISIDVGRKNDQTVVTVFRVYITSKGKFKSKIVNIFVLGKNPKDKTFRRQVIGMKKIIAAFRPKEVIIDVNGLGIGIADEMVLEQVDEDGNIWEALGFFNEEELIKVQPADAPKILNAFRSNQKMNSIMFSNCYSRIDSGLVDFLIKEQEARSKLLSTVTGQRMSLEQRTRLLMPYEMTSKLFAEMGNLRLKRTGLDISLEPINSRFPDDKFSSLCIGLNRIKELEEEHIHKVKKRLYRRNLICGSIT